MMNKVTSARLLMKTRKSPLWRGSGTGVLPVRSVQPTHGRDARATTITLSLCAFPGASIQFKTSDTPVRRRLFSGSHEHYVERASGRLDRNNAAKQVRDNLRGVKRATGEVTYGYDGEIVFAPDDRRRPAGRR